ITVMPGSFIESDAPDGSRNIAPTSPANISPVRTKEHHDILEETTHLESEADLYEAELADPPRRDHDETCATTDTVPAGRPLNVPIGIHTPPVAN
ncbi:hypothetical protein QBC45DRAFT_297602, partial [Copromyces sp. CBS 386.78]